MRIEGKISIAISLIAIIISIIAICNAYPRELGIDYLGWIVGVLALLTTILIGWNIYTTIDIKESHRQYISIINEVDISQHKVLAIQEHTNWMIYHQLLLNHDPCGLEFRFLYYGASCLYHTSIIGEYETCRMVVKALNECFTNPKAVTMTKSNKEQVILLLNLVKQPNKIEGYMDLMEKVALIGTK
jgi:hypothetical protein